MNDGLPIIIIRYKSFMVNLGKFMKLGEYMLRTEYSQ
mgnify:FL=1|jgi:hypothetical protein